MSAVRRKHKRWHALLSTREVRSALFCPKEGQTIALKVFEAGASKAQSFSTVVKISWIWAKNVQTRKKWEGTFHFNGSIRDCPQLALSGNSKAITKVTISGKMGKRECELKIM